MRIEVPDEYNGSLISFLSAILAIKEQAKVDPSVSVCFDVQNTLILCELGNVKKIFSKTYN
eukprot:snap_masked-scaffold_28-processed-gene-4.56-mRNA-1 protein AED:0.42 eAED:0.59 QI:0/0/0/1/1/1/2/0/60